MRRSHQVGLVKDAGLLLVRLATTQQQADGEHSGYDGLSHDRWLWRGSEFRQENIARIGRYQQICRSWCKVILRSTISRVNRLFITWPVRVLCHFA